MPKPSKRKAGESAATRQESQGPIASEGRARPRGAHGWGRPVQALINWAGLSRRNGKGAGAKPPRRPKLLTSQGHKRSLAEWKELRRRTAAEAKAHLREQQPLPAIRKLCRALLEDPQHQPYHALLAEAVQQRRQRRLKPGRRDPWLDLPEELQKQALQLEAFGAYVQEIEQLVDKAGIPPLAAPAGADQRDVAVDAEGENHTMC